MVLVVSNKICLILFPPLPQGLFNIVITPPHPIRNHSLFISWGMGVSEDFGENHTVFSGNRKGFRV